MISYKILELGRSGLCPKLGLIEDLELLSIVAIDDDDVRDPRVDEVLLSVLRWTLIGRQSLAFSTGFYPFKLGVRKKVILRVVSLSNGRPSHAVTFEFVVVTLQPFFLDTYLLISDGGKSGLQKKGKLWGDEGRVGHQNSHLLDETQQRPEAFKCNENDLDRSAENARERRLPHCVSRECG
ncbi:hypothetical protein EVAR_9895_1 [Eumeta japonica]|uniref:Uncharacterized protein n=1 Tax=Eumeta variegata TaxID=151549 RepID=A0A4C1TQC5_EUMVA|nr:hypothetical protein EVAR_9895_1 [Eumeta japonica]